MKRNIVSLFNQADQLLDSYQTAKSDWKSRKQTNELIVDLGARAIKDRTIGKYARKKVKSPKWKDSQECKQLESQYNSLKRQITKQLKSVYSLSRRGPSGNSHQISQSFRRRIDKVRLGTKLRHMRNFLDKLKDEELVDQKTWEVKKLQPLTKKINPYEEFLKDIIDGNFPKLTKEIIEIVQPPRETLWLEKKEQYDLTTEYNWIEFVRDLMSCANALTPMPIGIIVGLRDNSGTFVNAILPDEAEIRQRIISKLTPPIHFRILSLKFPNNTTGSIIAIQPTSKLHTFKKDWKIDGNTHVSEGEVWVREGTRKRKLKPKEIPKYAVNKSKIK